MRLRIVPSFLRPPGEKRPINAWVEAERKECSPVELGLPVHFSLVQPVPLYAVFSPSASTGLERRRRHMSSLKLGLERSELLVREGYFERSWRE